MSRIRMQVLGAAAIATAAMLVPTTPAQAAPATFQTTVLANNPYVYYRQNENPATGTAADTSGNSRPGTYTGGTTGGVAGAGLLSDNAVTYDGSSGYVLTSNSKSFGSSLGSSSYEFVFKVNPGAAQTRQSLYGVFDTGDSMGAEVTLNSWGNDAFGDKPGYTRLFVREGPTASSIGADFSDPTLYDGNYHHLVYTFDRSTLTTDSNSTGNGEVFAGGFRVYVDGVEQPINEIQRVGGSVGTLPTNFQDFNVDPTFVARNVRGTGVAGNGVGRYANVTLDEAALYGTVLSPTDVAAHATAAGFNVPEPTSLALLGLGGLGLLRRRRRSI